MTYNRFIWTDLSTFDMAKAREDYGALFGWSFGGDESYDFATSDAGPVAAAFPMPERLAAIDMPSFWMSYVHVESVDAAVAKAKAQTGAIIEVQPQPFNGDARIALVRDPSGAGFTLYEGPEIAGAGQGGGRVVGRYHQGPDVASIEAFYADLFGWTFRKAGSSPWPTFDILDADGVVVASAEEAPTRVRGKFSYWMPCFAVASTQDAISALADGGGGRPTELGDGRVIVSDRQGAHFMLRAVGPEPAGTAHSPGRGKPWAWRAVAGLGCVWLAVALDIQAFWGLLFLLWTWPAIKHRRIDFIDAVPRATRPALYWAIVGTWLVLSAWLILADLWPGSLS